MSYGIRDPQRASDVAVNFYEHLKDRVWAKGENLDLLTAAQLDGLYVAWRDGRSNEDTVQIAVETLRGE